MNRTSQTKALIFDNLVKASLSLKTMFPALSENISQLAEEVRPRVINIAFDVEKYPKKISQLKQQLSNILDASISNIDVKGDTKLKRFVVTATVTDATSDLDVYQKLASYFQQNGVDPVERRLAAQEV